MASGWWNRLRERRRDRALERRVDRFEQLLGTSAASRDHEAVAASYRNVLRDALEHCPARAHAVFATGWPRLTETERGLAFGADDESDLARLVESNDTDALTVIMELTQEIPLPGLRDRAASLLLPRLARGDDVHRLTGFLGRLQQLGFLTRARLTDAVSAHLERHSLDESAPAWSAVFDGLPDDVVPVLFDVAIFRERGAEAADLATTPQRRAAALRCCLGSGRIVDLRAALVLAERLGDEAGRRLGRERLAEALIRAGHADDAVEHLAALSRWDRVSAIHEQAGRWEEAVRSCPVDDPERLARLAGSVSRQVDLLVGDGRFDDGGGLASALVASTTSGSDLRARAETTLAGVRARAREHWADRLACSDRVGRAEVLADWSRFEERAGDPVEAAQLAADGGDRYRAHQLYRDAGRYGDAIAVLKEDQSPEARAARARAAARGGDLRGAAETFRAAGMLTEAARHYERAEDSAAAADIWGEQLGADAGASEDYVRCATRAGMLPQLVASCAALIERHGRATAALEHLRDLVRTHGETLDPITAERARTALGEPDAAERAAFEQRFPALLEQARREIDQRFSDVWALDLGTSTCVAAIYDTLLQRPVACPWRGRDRFPATVVLDEQGSETVGLDRDEELAAGVVGVLRGSKRMMGSRTLFRVRRRKYRAEEVAARLVSHARTLVEDHLANHVRERLGELVDAERNGELLAACLDRAEPDALRLSRHRVVVTVPAFFHNNQRNATRDAGVIGGTEVVRLVHEPTAACVAVRRQRRLAENVIVVDLGAGTLDLSWVEVGDDVYEVSAVDGDTHLGGADFDAIIATALEQRLTAGGHTVTASARRRLEAAAERLKMQLSMQEEAEETLAAFDGGEPVTLTLSRGELAVLLAGPIQRLAETCARFRRRIAGRVDLSAASLVLVGGPFLSPVVRAVAERALGTSSVGVTDPAQVVAHGAALLAAARCGDISDLLLFDVTPLPLGIRVAGTEQDGAFAELIAADTHIPVAKSRVFTTTADNQCRVRIEVFHGSISAESKVGEFVLDGLPPAAQGVPQVEVTFEIDRDGVLTVTAREVATGRSASVSLTDSTLLRPYDRDRMTEAFTSRRAREERRTRMRDALERADGELADGEALLREWRARSAGHRPAAPDPDPGIAAHLVEMYRNGTDVEAEIVHLELVLRDLLDEARGLLALPIDEAPVDDEESAHDRLERATDRHRTLRNTVARWNASLIASRAPDTDPAATLRRRHDADDHRGALEVWDRIQGDQAPVELVHRALDCLARLGERERYDALLQHHGLDPTGGTPTDQPATDPAAVAPSLARVDGPNGEPLAAGFVWSPNLLVVATATHEPLPPAEGLAVVLGDRPPVHMTVARRIGPLAALSTTVNLPALRAGYPQLLRIGDRLTIIPLHPDPETHVPALVQRLDTDSEPTTIVLGLDRSHPTLLGMALNAAGEVVGVTGRPQDHNGLTTAALVSWPDLPSLIASTGNDPWRT